LAYFKQFLYNRKKSSGSLLRLILLFAGVLYLIYYFNNIATTGI